MAEDFSLRQIAVPAFGPSAIWSVGVGAVLPVVALSARGLGASIAVAALFVGLTGLAEIAAAVPAGVLVERIGERRAIVLAGVVDAVACLLALVAPSLWVLALAVLLMGPSAAIFLTNASYCADISSRSALKYTTSAPHERPSEATTRT